MTDIDDCPPSPAQGLLARLIGIITSPRGDVRGRRAQPAPGRHPARWSRLVIALASSAPQFTDRGRQAALDLQVQQTEKFTGQPISDEQYAQMEKMSQYTRVFTLGRAVHLVFRSSR